MHRWLGNGECGDSCLHCGITVEYPWDYEDKPWCRDMNRWSASTFLGWCPGNDVERPHHMYEINRHCPGEERGLACHMCGVTTLDTEFDWECVSND